MHIVAGTEGAGPDVFEYTIRGERGSLCAHSLYQLSATHDGCWQPVTERVDDPATVWFRQQLDNIANWAGGCAHTMPDFAQALAVQETIETMLARRGAVAMGDPSEGEG